MMSEHKNGLPSLTMLTQCLRAAHITLRWDISLSGRMLLIANKNIPAQLRHLIWRYSRELLIGLILGDIRLCRNPDRHRRSWFYLSSKSRMFCCNLCYEQGLDNNSPLSNVEAERLIQMQSLQDALEEVTIAY